MSAVGSLIGDSAHTLELPTFGSSALIFQIPNMTDTLRSQALEILSPTEVERYGRMGGGLKQDSFLISRATLRLALGEAVGTAAHKIEIDTAQNRKPILKNGNLNFNVSHSGSWIALALSKKGPVGIDIEVPRETPRSAALADRFFSPDEAAFLNTHATERAEKLDSVFLRMWTAKEALLKAKGGAVPTDLPITRLQTPFTDTIQPVSPDLRLVEISGISDLIGHVGFSLATDF